MGEYVMLISVALQLIERGVAWVKLAHESGAGEGGQVTPEVREKLRKAAEAATALLKATD
jgi:Ni,Fe-hydrogenase maturation factor